VAQRRLFFSGAGRGRAVIAALALVALLETSVGDADASPAACDPAAAARLKRLFAEDMRTKDLKAVLSLYSADATFHEPDGTTTQGAVALRRLYRRTFATFDSDITLAPGVLTPVASPASGACAEQGVYREHLRRRATGQALAVKGGYRFVYGRDRTGRWRIREMAWLP
jgi:ketosteroid isomerase-like protein